MYRDPHDYDSTLALLIKPLTCTGCKLYEAPLGKPSGFIVPDGDGTRGVLIVAEAGSDAEEAAGIPLVNKNGHFYFNELNRVGLERDGFMITNTIACAPPHGRLTKTSFEHSCVQHCAPNLDATIAEARAIAHANGKTFTILTLGRVAFKRVMGYEDRHPIMKLDYLSYPHWNETYRAWVIASEHPAFLSRGQTHLVPVMTFAALRAVEIATHGLTLDQPTYLLDPPPMQFAQWVSDYLTYEALHREETYLSYDIETPMKQGKDEAEIAKEDDDDYTILRCSFAYVSGNAVSVPWTAAYAPYLERLFTSPGTKVGWNNEGYDAPRVMAQMPLKGPQIDGMLAWHVLNSALPKGLGFVTPFYVPNVGMWKHLSGSEPALYNAMDADYALRNWLGIQRDLKETQLWDVFNRHVITLNKVLSYMSEQGIPLDLKARQEAEDQLAVTLKDLKGQIDLAVPEEAKKLKIYKKTPKDTTGMVATLGSVKTTECPHCNLLGVKAVHYKSIGVKKLKAGATENPCVGLKSIKVDTTVSLWAIPLEFVISNLSLQRYQGVMKHQPVMDLKKKSVTFDEKAMLRLVRKYPKDTLYPLITTFRGIQKLLSTYVGVTQESGIIKGGMPVGKDGRIHSQVTHNPSTLRTAMQNPPMQTLPRPKGPDDPATLIRNLIVPAPGHTLYARDYCVDPDSKILKTNLTWITAQNIKIGDELIGFDEQFQPQKGAGKGKRAHNKFRPSMVIGVSRLKTSKLRVITSMGETIVSADHRFVARYLKYPRQWIYARDLKPGMLMPFFSKPWQPDNSRTGGYLAGFLDGEGYIGRGSVGFGQNQGETLTYVLQLLQDKNYCVQQHGRKTNKNFKYACVSGIGHQLRLLGEIRPVRLLSKAYDMWNGMQIASKCSTPAEVLSIELLSEGEVIAIETSTKTFISDGFFSHNCGIEAVLVGYEARSRDYIRLAKMDVHSFYTAYALNELDGRVSGNDLPLLSWDDLKLATRLADIKKEFKEDRNNLYKHLVHGANFMQGPKGASEKVLLETGISYPVKLVGKVMDLYFELFPAIKKWHSQVLYQADKDGFLRNPFGYVHRFSRVYDWEKVGGTWQKSPGPAANQAIAFGPQSTAAGIIKEALLRLFFERFEEAGQYLRLIVHDELFFEVLNECLEVVDRIVKEEMEKPIIQMALPDSYEMGPFLNILTESKQGLRWGEMS